MRDIRAKSPPGWNCAVIQADDVKSVPHGLKKPLFQFVASNTNVSFGAANYLGKQTPIILLYFYRLAEKSAITNIIEKERLYSWDVPIYFGETDEFIVITSPAYVNDGVFTPEARRALRPMWKVLRDLIPNREKAGVDGLARDN